LPCLIHQAFADIEDDSIDHAATLGSSATRSPPWPSGERRFKPVRCCGQPRTVKVPGTCRCGAGLDRALGKNSRGVSRKDGQDARVAAMVEHTLTPSYSGVRVTRTKLRT